MKRRVLLYEIQHIQCRDERDMRGVCNRRYVLRKRLLRLPVAALIAVITALILALAAGASVIFGWDGVLKDYLGISGTREDELRNSVME